MSKPMQLYKDDWLVIVIFDDGHVFIFQTEMWPEHLNQQPWKSVFQAAKDRAINLHDNYHQPYCIVSDPTNLTLARREIDAVTEIMSDSDFRRLVRR